MGRFGVGNSKEFKGRVGGCILTKYVVYTYEILKEQKNNNVKSKEEMC